VFLDDCEQVAEQARFGVVQPTVVQSHGRRVPAGRRRWLGTRRRRVTRRRARAATSAFHRV
jgi:hypothetical protein